MPVLVPGMAGKLLDASSVAALPITTEAMIAKKSEKKDGEGNFLLENDQGQAEDRCQSGAGQGPEDETHGRSFLLAGHGCLLLSRTRGLPTR